MGKANGLIEKADSIQRKPENLRERLKKGDSGDSSILASDILVFEREEIDDLLLM